MIKVGRDFWRASGPNSTQSNVLFQVRFAVCTDNVQVEPEMRWGDKSSHTLVFLYPVQHATRHTKMSGMRRPASIHTPRTHKYVQTTQVSVQTTFVATSGTALKCFFMFLIANKIKCPIKVLQPREQFQWVSARYWHRHNPLVHDASIRMVIRKAAISSAAWFVSIIDMYKLAMTSPLVTAF